MPKILTRTYSRHYDVATRTQFDPVLDRQSECYVGIADVDEETADEFEGRYGFEVLSEEEYLALVTPPKVEVKETGDPLKDGALQPHAKPKRSRQSNTNTPPANTPPANNTTENYAPGHKTEAEEGNEGEGTETSEPQNQMPAPPAPPVSQ